MPNLAPPRPRPQPTRTEPVQRPTSTGQTSAADAPGHVGVPTGGVPGAWAGAAALLAAGTPTLGTRAPLNTQLLETAAQETSLADLSAIWSIPQAPGRPDGRLVLRRLDRAGRLKLPLTLTFGDVMGVKVVAERRGPVLTVHLPGTDAQPEVSRLVAPLPLDERGRLTITRAVRAELGWDVGTDLMVVFVADRGLLELCAASALEDPVLAAMRQLRTPATSAAEAPAPPISTETVLPMHRAG